MVVPLPITGSHYKFNMFNNLMSFRTITTKFDLVDKYVQAQCLYNTVPSTAIIALSFYSEKLV